MTSRDVPTATRIGTRSSSVSAGTIAKPPPTPKNPVSRLTPVAAPTRRPHRVRCATRCDPAGAAAPPSITSGWPRWTGTPGSEAPASRPRRTISAAMTSSSPPNIASSRSPSTRCDSRVPRADPSTPHRTKAPAIRASTRLRRPEDQAETREEMPTTTSDIVVAGTASTPKPKASTAAGSAVSTAARPASSP